MGIWGHRERLGLTMEEAAALFPGFDGSEALARRTWQDWEAERRTPPGWTQEERVSLPP